MSEPARALIVEDDRTWQQILAELLSDAGLLVEITDNTDQAIRQLRTRPHRLAVIDLSLSDDPHNQDGLCVLQAIRRHDPACVAILLTGYATVELAVEAINHYGALTCLRKEMFARAEFCRLIQQALARPPSAQQPAPLVGQSSLPKAAAIPVGTALLVEDDAGWRNILSELLTDAGYAVRPCNGYGEALGCLRRERFALAVIDLLLYDPRQTAWQPADPTQPDGYRLLALAREHGVPTVVVSGVAQPDEIEQLYAEHGVFACLQKQNFDRRAFLQTLTDLQTARLSESGLDTLTERERQVLAMLAQGLVNKEIARALVITENTVKRHIKAIFEKLDVHTRAAAVAKAVDAGILPRT